MKQVVEAQLDPLLPPAALDERLRRLATKLDYHHRRNRKSAASHRRRRLRRLHRRSIYLGQIPRGPGILR